MEALERWADRNGLKLTDPSLLRRALTHRSYVNENQDTLEDNERLEFLGDAALDFLSAAWLYQHFPEMDEGQLTRLRSALVRTEQLAEFAEEMGTGEVLQLGRGEDLSGGRARPALLCATFEAIMGALFLDKGIAGVRQFIEPRFRAAVDAIMADERLFDARSMLQIWAQGEVGTTPMYRTLDSTGPDHARSFVVEVTVGERLRAKGEGSSKQEAAQHAAAAALSQLGWQQPPAD